MARSRREDILPFETLLPRRDVLRASPPEEKGRPPFRKVVDCCRGLNNYKHVVARALKGL